MEVVEEAGGERSWRSTKDEKVEGGRRWRLLEEVVVEE